MKISIGRSTAENGDTPALRRLYGALSPNWRDHENQPEENKSLHELSKEQSLFHRAHERSRNAEKYGKRQWASLTCLVFQSLRTHEVDVRTSL
jgi:hypothetical protein